MMSRTPEEKEPPARSTAAGKIEAALGLFAVSDAARAR